MAHVCRWRSDGYSRHVRWTSALRRVSQTIAGDSRRLACRGSGRSTSALSGFLRSCLPRNVPGADAARETLLSTASVHDVGSPVDLKQVYRSRHWIRQVAALCNVADDSGMTCHWIRPNVRHIGILHMVSISTISPQSTCHSAPVCEILSKSDHPRQRKMTSCRFSRWQISAILDFRGPIMGFLKSPCTTFYRSPIEIIALNCLVCEKIAFFAFWRQTDRQTNEQMDSVDALSRSPCRERRLNKYLRVLQTQCTVKRSK